MLQELDVKATGMTEIVESTRSLLTRLGKNVLRDREPKNVLFDKQVVHKFNLGPEDYISPNGYAPQKLISRKHAVINRGYAQVHQKKPLAVPQRRVIEKKLESGLLELYERSRLGHSLIENERATIALMNSVYGIEDNKLVNLPLERNTVDNAIEIFEK